MHICEAVEDVQVYLADHFARILLSTPDLLVLLEGEESLPILDDDVLRDFDLLRHFLV